MRTHKLLPAVAIAALVFGACQAFDVPDLNNPGLDELQTNPTRTGVLTAATGLLIGNRAGHGNQNGYESVLGIFGRESYNFDPADPRFVTELLVGPLDGGSPAFGGNLWGAPYANIRNANILLAATTAVTGLSAAEKEGIRGFAKTIQALDFLKVSNTRDSLPIDVDISPTGSPAPFVSHAAVLTHIANLLDSANTHLTAAGASFPFALGTGYAGFNTPASFRTFNRALRARVAVYMKDFAGALTALTGSFIDTSATASLTAGVYHTFGTGSGDVLNAVYDPLARAILAHPSLSADAQLQAGGAKDARFTSKVTTVTPAHSAQNHSSGFIFTIFTSSTSPVSIIRNEELILLRAEANIGLNNLAGARNDINYIRVHSGGLAPVGPFGSATLALDELLYNKRYSLMFEGLRWIDMRNYNRLSQLPLDLPGDKRFTYMPVPTGECDPRSPKPSACGTIAGF